MILVVFFLAMIVSDTDDENEDAIEDKDKHDRLKTKSKDNNGCGRWSKEVIQVVLVKRGSFDKDENQDDIGDIENLLDNLLWQQNI